MGELKLTSEAFENNGKIPEKYTCVGENINPPLQISDVPEKTKSLVLIVDDPDAVKPTGKVWEHWTVWNINPNTKEIQENSVPEGAIQGVNGAGKNNYQGPCPPDGEHRYFFKLFALDTTLNLQEGATKKQVEEAIQNHIIAQTQLIGLFTK